MKYLITFLLITSVLLFSGCTKEEGCTNPDACNFSQSAEEDDGSCHLPGDDCDDGDDSTILDQYINTATNAIICQCLGVDLILGCTDDLFIEYDPTANLDDNSCSTLLGCSEDDFVEYSGYSYSLISIGEQCWFSENCRYLPEVSPSSEGSESDPYYYVYGYEGTDVAAAMSTSNYATYGVLYNWPAVMTEEICPSGWHIPSDEEFTELTDFLGGESVAGGKMKEAGNAHWNYPNTGASNSSGWAGLPGGVRDSGGFYGNGSLGYWWSASESGSFSWVRELDYNYVGVYRNYNYRDNGFSARCVRD
jgi:uncharacterized protein (TIGR02145 family)